MLAAGRGADKPERARQATKILLRIPLASRQSLTKQVRRDAIDSNNLYCYRAGVWYATQALYKQFSLMLEGEEL